MMPRILDGVAAGMVSSEAQNLIDPVQDYNLGRRTKIGIACGVDNSRLIESELPSRIFGVGYDQMECLDIQELISGHCNLLFHSAEGAPG